MTGASGGRHTISAGESGFEYPGDGVLPGPAELSMTDVGWKSIGQNSNTP